MDNPRFFDEETIPLVQDEVMKMITGHQKSRVDKTSFIEPDTIIATSTLRLRHKLKRDETVSLYKYLDVTRDPGLLDLDRFTIKKKFKTVNIELLFLNVNIHWKSLTNGPVSF